MHTSIIHACIENQLRQKQDKSNKFYSVFPFKRKSKTMYKYIKNYLL